MSNWSFRFLNLGDRLILLKSVISSILVYWFSLVKILASITTSIRTIMCNFLSGGKEAKKGSHLVKWDMITRPYAFGGWNVKNLQWFNIALSMKSLWMALSGNGIWNKVLWDKYLR